MIPEKINVNDLETKLREMANKTGATFDGVEGTLYLLFEQNNILIDHVVQQDTHISNLNSHLETSKNLFIKMEERIKYLEQANRVRSEFEGI